MSFREGFAPRMEVDPTVLSQNRTGWNDDPTDTSGEEMVSHTLGVVDVAYKYKLNTGQSKHEEPGALK
jgi:hypothetical protein